MSIAIEAKRHEAVDFIDKPVCSADLVCSVHRALGQTVEKAEISKFRKLAELKVTGLTSRERQILDLILDGHSNKSIAADLGISQRTVEVHRAAIMKKIETKNFAALVRTALCDLLRFSKQNCWRQQSSAERYCQLSQRCPVTAICL